MADVDNQHRPVLLTETIEALAIKPDGFYVDGTFGRGGHAAEVMACLNENGSMLAFDQDSCAIESAKLKFGNDSRFEIVKQNFENIESTVQARGPKLADGILLDIGVSSPQLDDAERGFSFMRSGPLDMRMNPDEGESAAEWLAVVPEYDLTTVLMHFGEEKFARRIANAIVTTRDEIAITDTVQLADIIEAAIPVKPKNHKHPATKSFQAIRIHINRELEVLERALRESLNVLAVGGRLAVISFHSLEDRSVKRFFRDISRGPQFPKDIPILAKDLEQPYKQIGKAIKPSKQEIEENPRSRSSVLRVIERIK